MSETMRERIIWAMTNAMQKDHAFVPGHVTDAVLTAMQEPTEAMIRAGVGRQVNHDWHESTGRDLAQMRDCWYNMIDAATKEDGK